MVAFQPDVANRHVRKKIEKRLHHAQARAQDWHDGDRFCQHPALEWLQRRLDRFVLGREVAGGLERQQQRDLVTQRAKQRGLGRLVAQVREHMVGERMLQDVQRHDGQFTDREPRNEQDYCGVSVRVCCTGPGSSGCVSPFAQASCPER